MVFVDDIADVPPGRPIMLSAHGSAPEVVAAARARGSYVVDSVCPLVTKVHHEVKVRAGKGYRIVYVGHEGHEEAVGTMAVAPDSISRVESVAEVDALPDFDEPVALLAQTTLSHRDWEGVAVRVRERFPDVWTPGRSDLCFATTNRQSALMAMAARCDAIVVIGSANSSNTRALEKLAGEAGCRAGVPGQRAPMSCPTTSPAPSASPPAPRRPKSSSTRSSPASRRGDGVEVVRVTDEDEYFPPPRNIRDLQSGDRGGGTAMLGGAILDRPPMDDRSLRRQRRARRAHGVVSRRQRIDRSGSVARHLAPRDLAVDAHVAGQAEHTLAEDVLHHLGGAALDRVGPAAQERLLQRVVAPSPSPGGSSRSCRTASRRHRAGRRPWRGCPC